MIVPYNQGGTGAVNQTVGEKLSEKVSVKDFGAVGDYDLNTGLGTNDTTAIQQNATDCDTNNWSYMYVPNHHENYLIEAPITFTNPGIRIFGDGGPSYYGRSAKNGNIVIGTGASSAFDLSNSRTTGNPADNWAIHNIAMIPKLGITAGTKNGIVFTSKTNGPDRGAQVISCSGAYLNAAVYIPDPGVATALATLCVENCCFSNNNYACLSTNANIFGARFVSNQMEQNALGAIHGAFNGPVYIADNMLEGQPNPINITVPSIAGNRPSVVIERNYFEANTGEYLIKYACQARGTLVVKDNFVDSQGASAAYDYILIEGAGTVTVTNGQSVFDNQPITQNGFAEIAYGSDIFPAGITYYNIRIVPANRCGPVIIGKYANLIDTNGNDVHTVFVAGTQYQTPYGLQYCISGGAFAAVALSVAVGDVFTINALVFRNGETAEFQVWNAGITGKLVEGNISTLGLSDNWALVSYTCIADQISASLNIRFLNASANSLVAGVTSRNYGAHINDGTAIKSIYPVVPNFV
jgi:hypothetical protein